MASVAFRLVDRFVRCRVGHSHSCPNTTVQHSPYRYWSNLLSPVQALTCLGVVYPSPHQVWSAEQSDWTCKIDEGPAGVQAARWAPDGTAVLVSAVAGIRTTVWSLSSRRCHYLPGAKACDGAAAAFSPDGRVMVQVGRA